MHSRVYSGPLKDDKSFTCAQLRTLSFDKLVNRDDQELAILLAAGEKDGFFYLDLTKPESKGLYDDYKGVLSVMATWFDQPIESKSKFAFGSDIQGYDKPYHSTLFQSADKSFAKLQAHWNSDRCYGKFQRWI